jgi:hypothetical protein
MGRAGALGALADVVFMEGCLLGMPAVIVDGCRLA